jgi:non-ribosomal peptide synthetase component F
MDTTNTNESTQASSPDALDDSPLPSAQELDEIWVNNTTVPDSVEGCVHKLITDIAQRQPDALAVCAWDGDFTYAQISALSDHVARRLCEMGISPRSPVPLLFPKSRWTCVAMMGIMKTGRSAIALDATYPDARLQSIIRLAQPTAIVCSEVTRTRVSVLCDTAVVQLDDNLLEIAGSIKDVTVGFPEVCPGDTAYISFTS